MSGLSAFTVGLFVNPRSDTMSQSFGKVNLSEDVVMKRCRCKTNKVENQKAINPTANMENEMRVGWRWVDVL